MRRTLPYLGAARPPRSAGGLPLDDQAANPGDDVLAAWLALGAALLALAALSAGLVRPQSVASAVRTAGSSGP